MSVADENLGIELHDSEITGITLEGGTLILRLDAHVHHSAGMPGVDAGTGWIHGAELRFGQGRLTSPAPSLPVEISNGTLDVGDRHLDNGFPVPLELADPVRLDLELQSGERLSFEGDTLSVVLLDEGRLVEVFQP